VVLNEVCVNCVIGVILTSRHDVTTIAPSDGQLR